MINKYTNKQRGLLAVIMAMVMVFAGAAFVAAEVDGAKITYISGEIMDDQTYGQGAIVVMNGDLTVEDGKSLIIAQGASFTVEAGYTLTISEDASLVVLNGAYFNAIGDVVVETNGSIENNSIYDATTKVDGKIAGFFINGNVTLEDGATITGSTTDNSSVTAEGLTSGMAVSSHNNGEQKIFDVTENSGVWKLAATDTSSNGVGYHKNGVGNFGYWVGVKVLTSMADGTEVKVNIDGRVVDDEVAGGGYLYFWTTAGKSVIISYEDDGVDKKFILDATAVTIADGSPAGQIIVNGSLTTESKTKTHSVIADQIISVSKDASFTLEGDAENTIVNAFTDASKDVYTYGSIVLDSDYDGETTNGTGNVMDLKITTVQEKIPVAYADGKKITKAYNLILDVSGTVAGATITGAEYNPTLGIIAVPGGFNLADSEGEESSIVAAGIVRITGDLKIGEDATLNIGSILDVDGTLTVDGKDGQEATLNASGVVYVSGTIDVGPVENSSVGIADNDLTVAPNFNGAFLIIEADGCVTIEGDIAGIGVLGGIFGASYTDDDDFTYITGFQKAMDGAIAADVDEIYLMGLPTNTVVGDMPYIIGTDATIVDGLEVKLINTITIDEGVTLTIEDGAEITASAVALIVVDGTLIDYNMDDALVYGTTATANIAIDAEVKAIDADETYYKYTTLSNALSTAVDGETIQLFGNVVVENTLTIPAGVTIDTQGKTITVKKGAVLTVDGTIDNRDNGQVILNKGDEFTDDGKIIVNNIVVNPNIVDNAVTPEEVKVAGIYATGTIGDYEDADFLLAPAVAAENSSVISNATVDAETTYNGDLTFTAGEDNTAVLTVNSKFTVGTITIVGYEIIISNVDGSDDDANADAIFTGKVAATNGALDLKSVKPTTVDADKIIIRNVVDEDAGTDVLTIAGKPVMVDKDGKVVTDSKKNVVSISIASGTVTVDKSATLDVSNLGFTVAEGTVLDVNKTVIFNKMTIAGTVNINGGASLTGQTVSGNNTLEVLGTLSVKQATADNNTVGTVTITGDVYVGVLKKSVVSGTATIDAASINGCNVMYVAAGSIIPEDMVKDIDSIQFIIEDSLYITAYNMGKANDAAATINKAPVENAKFLGWNNDKGKLITDGDNADYSIDFATYDKVTAAIDYNIYTVNIVADNGIGTVAIDGIVLQKNGNTFSASKLVAGEHTLSYELKNGYEGTVKMTVDGKAVDGYKFTLSGTDAEDLVVDINLSGTTQIEYSTATDSGEDDGGMTLVEILLIVLVVLVVILAVIVALRMMRS